MSISVAAHYGRVSVYGVDPGDYGEFSLSMDDALQLSYDLYCAAAGIRRARHLAEERRLARNVNYFPAQRRLRPTHLS